MFARQNPAAPVHPAPLTATWGITLPRHLAAAVAAAPVQQRGTLGHYTYLVSDLARLYPVPHRSAYVDRPCTELVTAAVALLLQAGAEISTDHLKLSTDLDVFGPQLEVRHAETFDIAFLAPYLPISVLHWLERHTATAAAAWTALLIAEIQMHAVHVAIGALPRPHSPASDIALRGILAGARVHLYVIARDDEGLWEEFETLGGTREHDNVLTLLDDLLFTDDRVLDALRDDTALPDEASLLHPRNWFRSFTPADNPWLDQPPTR